MEFKEIPFQGASMNPLFEGASHVLVDFFDHPAPWPSKAAVGDVVLYKQDNEWICHRCIGVEADGPLLKGDYNTTFEKKSSVIVWGIVRGYVKNGVPYRTDYFRALRWLCFFQRGQCESRSYISKKIYRAASLGLLSFNKIFFTRKYSQLAS